MTFYAINGLGSLLAKAYLHDACEYCFFALAGSLNKTDTSTAGRQKERHFACTRWIFAGDCAVPAVAVVLPEAMPAPFDPRRDIYTLAGACVQEASNFPLFMLLSAACSSSFVIFRAVGAADRLGGSTFR